MKETILGVSIAVFLVIGEFKCFIKMVKCNWDPIGTSELFYTFGTFTGTGAIIGYFDIKDK